jgi:hypothetical protein
MYVIFHLGDVTRGYEERYHFVLERNSTIFSSLDDCLTSIIGVFQTNFQCLELTLEIREDTPFDYSVSSLDWNTEFVHAITYEQSRKEEFLIFQITPKKGFRLRAVLI